MARELIVFPESTAVFAPQYFGSIGYYAAVSAYERVRIDSDMPADKRFKSAHRCRIVDTRDEINLTVPVSHPHGRHSWAETPVSAHGRWWHVHLTALESAYGRTPFFEYYIDRFAPIFETDYATEIINVGELDRRCDQAVRNILMIDNEVNYGFSEDPYAADMRKADFNLDIFPIYYQVRAERLGFRAGLSVLDLIFNLGPEAPLYLKEVQKLIFKL